MEIKSNNISSYFILKRIIDLIVSSVAIIIFSPVMIVIAVIIMLTSEGPVFADMPNRVGRYGKPFKMYKFRSMILNAHTKLRTDPEFARLYEEYKENSYKILDDPRVTKIGKFIRKTSLDELPQFLNVFIGNMSIVGPRAYFADELEEQARNYPKARKLIKRTLTVKPGITGPWQVGGRSQISFNQRIKMDAEYAQSHSLFYDFKLMLKTPFAVLFGKGAY